MKILELLSYFFTGYIDFEGRCDRPTFWVIVPVFLVCFTVITFLSIRFEGAPRQILFWGFLLATFVPFLSIIVKRLHDFGVTGYAVIALLPLAFFGDIWLPLLAVGLISFVPPTRGMNKYGEDARGGNASVFD